MDLSITVPKTGMKLIVMNPTHSTNVSVIVINGKQDVIGRSDKIIVVHVLTTDPKLADVIINLLST